MFKTIEVDIEKLKEKLDYNPETGEFTNRKTGNKIGHYNGKGYVVIKVLSKKLRAHRIAFAMVYGWWPTIVDHKDGNRANNKISNLIASDHSANTKNSERRRKGEYIGAIRYGNRWKARVRVNNEEFYLGTFHTREEAAQAVREFEAQHDNRRSTT